MFLFFLVDQSNQTHSLRHNNHKFISNIWLYASYMSIDGFQQKHQTFNVPSRDQQWLPNLKCCFPYVWKAVNLKHKVQTVFFFLKSALISENCGRDLNKQYFAALGLKIFCYWGRYARDPAEAVWQRGQRLLWCHQVNQIWASPIDWASDMVLWKFQAL